MTAKRSGRKGGAHTTPTWHDHDELRWAVRHWATRLGVRAPQIHLRQMRSKWASISTAGRLTLNTDLLTLPRDLGDFVAVHELVHLLAPNHGKLFKSFMHAYMPDWEERAERLKRYNGAGTKPGDQKQVGRKAMKVTR